MTRRRLADGFIQLGLLLQLVFLFFVDWGSIAGILRQRHTPWAHVAGLVAVNVVLLPAAVVAWKWLRARSASPSHAGPTRASRASTRTS